MANLERRRGRGATLAETLTKILGETPPSLLATM